MTRVTVRVDEAVVVVRGRDASGAVRHVEVVPRAEMSEAHVEAMRARLTSYASSSPSAPHASQTRPR